MYNFIEAQPLVPSFLKLVYLSKLDTNTYCTYDKYGYHIGPPGSLNVYNFGLCSVTADKMGGWGCDEAVSEKATLRCGLLQKYLFYGCFLPNSGITLHPWIDHFHTHAKTCMCKKIPLVTSVMKYPVKKGSRVSRLQPGCH
jgi:hypothetical protein